MSNVLDTEVDTLLKVSVPYDLVDDHTDCGWRDVVYDSSSSVIVLVGHTLLLGGIRLDVDDISNVVVDEEGGQLGRSVVLEPLLEHVARTRPVTE